MFNLDSYTATFQESIDFFQREIGSLRTGRATPALVDNLMVDAYGTKTPLMHLASVSTPDPRSLVIQPWDKGVLKDIEKAIITSDMGINPRVDSDVIRIAMPPLSEENRKNLVKLLSQKAEAARVSIRQHREKTKADIVKAFDNGELSEDDKFKALKQLDDVVKRFVDVVGEIADKKEAEIMTV